MVQPRYNKSVRTSALYFFTIQLLLYSIAISGSENSTSSPSGAEFLKNVIGNLQKPIRRTHPVNNDRIDVEEYIPYDTPNEQVNEIKMLTKMPFNSNGQNVNNPSQSESGTNQVGSLFSQIIPQFLKNEFVESQTNAVAQSAPQNFNSAPDDSQAQNVIDALSGDISRPPDGTISGYNYFFYPLDAKGLQQVQQYQQQQQQQQNGNNQQQQQQQNGQSSEMDATKSEMANKPKVQPLFVAMAGFVGIAVVFLSALMFIPILPVPILSSKGVLKRAPEELASLTKLVAESIDGKDCSERIACEVGRAMRSMRVGSKPIRMMEIILPPSVAKQLAQIRRSASKKEQCHFITCRRTEGTLKLVAKLKKNNPHNKTIHDVKEIFNMD